MKHTIRIALAVLLAAVMLLLPAAMPASATTSAADPELIVQLDSNFFPQQKHIYYDLSQYEDANGDIFITVLFSASFPGKKIVQIDIDELTWDPAVLEWSADYNYYGTGRNKTLDVFPFSAEHNRGPGMVNTTTRPGRIVGNGTWVSPAVWGYNEDGSPLGIVRSVFKLIDRNAKSTVINCSMDTLGLCDENDKEPSPNYRPIQNTNFNEEVYSTVGTYFTGATPEDVVIDKPTGDVDGDGRVTIQDATCIQQMLAEFTDDGGAPLFDRNDPYFFWVADANHDGKISISDVTQIQRYLAEYIPTLEV